MANWDFSKWYLDKFKQDLCCLRRESELCLYSVIRRLILSRLQKWNQNFSKMNIKLLGIKGELSLIWKLLSDSVFLSPKAIIENPTSNWCHGVKKTVENRSAVYCLVQPITARVGNDVSLRERFLVELRLGCFCHLWSEYLQFSPLCTEAQHSLDILGEANFTFMWQETHLLLACRTPRLIGSNAWRFDRWLHLISSHFTHPWHPIKAWVFISINCHRPVDLLPRFN